MTEKSVIGPRRVQDLYRAGAERVNRITPFYILKDYKGQLLRGKFLQHQLTPANIDTYRGHVIDERIKKGKKEYLFKFKGYDDKYNEWMSASQLKKLK